MMEYTVIETGGLTVLKLIVNAEIAKGWEPLGGITVKHWGENLGHNYLQAMVRDDAK